MSGKLNSFLFFMSDHHETFFRNLKKIPDYNTSKNNNRRTNFGEIQEQKRY